MGKKSEMRDLAIRRNGETFTATGLAAELGWKRTGRKVRAPAHNSTAALRIARKMGMPVALLEKKTERNRQNAEGEVEKFERTEKFWEITLKAPTPAGGAS